jgi:hypothetical protein
MEAGKLQAGIIRGPAICNREGHSPQVWLSGQKRQLFFLCDVRTNHAGEESRNASLIEWQAILPRIINDN